MESKATKEGSCSSYNKIDTWEMHERKSGSLLRALVRIGFWCGEQSLDVLVAGVECICRRRLDLYVGAPGGFDA